MIRIPALRALLGFALVALSAIAPAPALSAPIGTTHSVDVNLSGWKSVGFVGSPLNSQLVLTVAPGTQVLGFDYFNLSFVSQGESFLDELVLSVASESDFDLYLEHQPSSRTESGGETGLSGSYSPLSWFSYGEPFTVADGKILVSVWDLYDHGGSAVDTLINSGTLRIHLAGEVPEPASFALTGLGLLLLGSWSRRRAPR